MSICPCNCKYHRSMDIRTPRMVPLSAFYKRSFAFHSVRERFPVVIKKIMEDLMKRRDELAKEFGEGVREELKKIVDELAALKYELQSNREMTPIVSEYPDAEVFNYHLERMKVQDGHASPYNTNILFHEAYMYRRIRSIFETKKILKNYDHFKKIKEDAFEDAVPVMRELAIHMEEGCECISDKDAIFDLMKIALWANKYDLSINKGVEQGTHINMARKMEPNVVCDHSESIWEAFRSNRENDSIAYVVDNAGYELFCDLCLSDMLFTKELTSHVTFHTKTIPSYVSDVTTNDINWMIQKLKKHMDPHLRCLGQRWDDYMANKTWEIEEHPFWHYPLDYGHMQEYAPELHEKLATANLIMFKGDLNYRKLFGDINWDPDIPVDQGLRGFLPAKLCALRTIKYGVICGITDEMADKCMKADINWKESGNYAVIQYCDTIYVEPPQEEMIFPPDPGAEGSEGAEAGPKAAEDTGEIEEEAPQAGEVEGGGDLGQPEETAGGETRRGDAVAQVVASLVGHSAREVDHELGEEERPADQRREGPIPETDEEQVQHVTESDIEPDEFTDGGKEKSLRTAHPNNDDGLDDSGKDIGGVRGTDGTEDSDATESDSPRAKGAPGVRFQNGHEDTDGKDSMDDDGSTSGSHGGEDGGKRGVDDTNTDYGAEKRFLEDEGSKDGTSDNTGTGKDNESVDGSGAGEDEPKDGGSEHSADADENGPKVEAINDDKDDSKDGGSEGGEDGSKHIGNEDKGFHASEESKDEQDPTDVNASPGKETDAKRPRRRKIKTPSELSVEEPPEEEGDEAPE